MEKSPEFNDSLSCKRFVAWSQMEFCSLGRHTWTLSGDRGSYPPYKGENHKKITDQNRMHELEIASDSDYLFTDCVCLGIFQSRFHYRCAILYQKNADQTDTMGIV